MTGPKGPCAVLARLHFSLTLNRSLGSPRQVVAKVEDESTRLGRSSC